MSLPAPEPAPPTPVDDALPARIVLAQYPQLRRLAWSAPGLSEVTPREAFGL